MYKLGVKKKLLESEHKDCIAIKINKDSKIQEYVNIINRKPKEPHEDKLIINYDEELKYFPYLYTHQNQRYSCFISGYSGLGKSVYCSKLIMQLKSYERFRKLPVCLISASKDTDPAFEDIKNFIKVDIYDEEFMSFDNNTFANTITIFDDYEHIPGNPNLEKHINVLLNSILEHNRKKNTHVIVISHLTTNYAKTRTIINECSNYVLFSNGDRNSIRRFCKSYLGFDDEYTNKILNYYSRTLYISKSSPMYLICDKNIELIL